MKLETICGFMFLIFLALKLTHHLDWSWWWVTAPLWGLYLVVIAFVCLFGFLDHKYGLRRW